jgi:hypothetical protein
MPPSKTNLGNVPTASPQTTPGTVFVGTGTTPFPLRGHLQVGPTPIPIHGTVIVGNTPLAVSTSLDPNAWIFSTFIPIASVVASVVAALAAVMALRKIAQQIILANAQLKKADEQIELAIRQIDLANRQIDIATRQTTIAERQTELALEGIDWAKKDYEAARESLQIADRSLAMQQEAIAPKPEFVLCINGEEARLEARREQPTDYDISLVNVGNADAPGEVRVDIYVPTEWNVTGGGIMIDRSKRGSVPSYPGEYWHIPLKINGDLVADSIAYIGVLGKVYVPGGIWSLIWRVHVGDVTQRYRRVVVSCP